MFRKCVCDLQIIHYTEFEYFSPFRLISLFAYLPMILVAKLLNFDFVLALKSSLMITVSLVLNVLAIDDSFSHK